MILVGHIIAAKLASKLVRGDDRVSIAGSLFPDVVDKSLNLIGLSPSGRIPAHGFVVGLSSTFLVYILGLQRGLSRRWGLSWGAGYLSHLSCDVEAGLPWFLYPIHYEHEVEASVPMDWLFRGDEPVPKWTLVAEALLVAAQALWTSRRGRR